MRPRLVVSFAPLLFAFVGAAAHSHADECSARVALEGVSDAAVERRLVELVRREGGCASPWVLRISAAPRGQFMVALWTGSDLETRWANGLPEAETVAALLLRTAVEHRDAARPPSASAPAPTAEAPPTTVVSAGPSPSWSPRAGVFAGVAVATAAGAGPEIGVDLTYGTPRISFGVAPRWTSSSRDGGSRSSIVVPAIARLGFLPSPSFWLGAQVEVGLDVERATGAASGTTATLGANGLSFGAGGRFALSLGAGWDAALVASVRDSTASASPAEASTTTTQPGGNNGKGVGGGAPKTTTTSTVDPASADAASRLAGASFSATLGIGRSF